MKTSAAVRWAGSISALARIVPVSRQAIQQWGEDVPYHWQSFLEDKSIGKLKARKYPKKARRVV